MKELLEYRTRLIDRLVWVAQEFSAACLAQRDAFALLADSAWTIHQLAVHVRDVDKLVYGLRARRTAMEDNPEFQNFDSETHMSLHYSAGEPLQEILNELCINVGNLADDLRKLPVNAWSRESRHVTFGRGFTMQTWIERDLAHIEEHMATVKKNS